MAKFISKNRVLDLINRVNSVNGFTSYEDYVELIKDVETSCNPNVQSLSAISIYIKSRLYETALNSNDANTIDIIADIAERIDFWLNEIKDGEK